MTWIHVALLSTIFGCGFAVGWIVCEISVQIRENKRQRIECDRIRRNL